MAVFAFVRGIARAGVSAAVLCGVPAPALSQSPALSDLESFAQGLLCQEADGMDCAVTEEAPESGLGALPEDADRTQPALQAELALQGMYLRTDGTVVPLDPNAEVTGSVPSEDPGTMAIDPERPVPRTSQPEPVVLDVEADDLGLSGAPR